LRDRANRQRLDKLLKSLVKSKWSQRFENDQDECCICLGQYSQGQLIVTLPCDSKHYFHDHCISKWLLLHEQCPFCKLDVTVEAIKQQKELIKI
jgi:hypothetical protein